MMSWPSEHVAWQGIIDAWPEMEIPFATHVFVFHNIEQLREACGDPEANAHSSTFREVDDHNVGALVLLTADALELSIIAHEAAHISLFHHRNSLASGDRMGARRWLGEHPESIAEMIGNLTAAIWFGLPEHPAA